jgi:hypothetical protein
VLCFLRFEEIRDSFSVIIAHPFSRCSESVDKKVVS